MFFTGDTQRSSSSTATGSSAGVGGERRPLVGLLEQGEHAAADDVAGRLVAADQQQQRLVHDRLVVEAVPVDLGLRTGC